MYRDSAPPAPSCLLIISPSPRKIYFFVYHPEFESYLSKLLRETINANGFRANHTSKDGNHIHERIFSFPDSFTLGKTINRKFGKDVGERTSSPDVDKDFVCPSVTQNLIFFNLENLIHYLCLKESSWFPSKHKAVQNRMV